MCSQNKALSLISRQKIIKMNYKKFFFSISLCLSFFLSQAQGDPNNLFLVDVENIYNVQMAGKILERPSVGNRSLSAEEILMYEILNCKFENGKWIRYTANSNGKGSLKVGHPFLQADENRLFFVSDIKGGAGGFDIYYSVKINGQWSDPTNLGLKVNSPEDELFPFVTDANILQIYRGSTQLNFDLSQIIDIKASHIPVTTQKPEIQPNIIKPETATQQEQTVQHIEPVVEKEKAKEEPQTKAPKEVEYRVQIGAYSQPNWNILNELREYGTFNTMSVGNGLTSVHIGSFDNLEDAKNLARQIQQRPGFGNAYVVEIKNGEITGRFR